MKVYVVSCEDHWYQASIFPEDRTPKSFDSKVLAVFTNLAEAKDWVRSISAFMKEVDSTKYRDELDTRMHVCGQAEPMHERKYKIETLELNQNTKKNLAWARRLKAMGLNPAAFSRP